MLARWATRARMRAMKSVVWWAGGLLLAGCFVPVGEVDCTSDVDCGLAFLSCVDSRCTPSTGQADAGRTDAGRAVAGQALEIAVDALDIAAVQPFWRAVLGYVDERPEAPDASPALVDPAGIGPAVWFQQMDAPRPQRNRVHLDVSVPHDVAVARVEAALAAGGRLVSDRRAPAFWVLADAEGNEACVCTWQGREGA